MLELYKDFCHKFPVVTIEDPFEQDDWEPCIKLTADNICQVRPRTAESGRPPARTGELLPSDARLQLVQHANARVRAENPTSPALLRRWSATTSWSPTPRA
jgi:hypothetical protein